VAVELCKLINFRKIADPRGNLTPIEGKPEIPFDIEHVSYVYDVPGGATRGGHAHKQLEQIVISMSGSFDVIVKDGSTSKRFHLNRPYYGLYLPAMVWRDLDNFSSGSVCLVLGSHRYDENDYYRKYEDFAQAIGGR